MAGSIVISSIQLDSDNNFSILSNTGATLVSANGSGLNVSSSLAPDSITSDKIVSVANTKIAGNIVSSQITSVANTQLTGTVTNAQVGSSVYEGIGFRNRIINGDMRIDQRNAGASVTPSADSTYTLDRWFIRNTSGAGRFSVIQSSTSAANFPISVLLTNTTTAVPGTNEFYGFGQNIEGYNISDFGWGTANAKDITISFRVRSSLTGTYCVSVRNTDATRSFVAEFSIDSADTFETKTVTIPGETSGSWGSTTSAALLLLFCLGSSAGREGTAGSWQTTNIVGTSNQVDWINTSGATFYITGVQLEVGSVATPFERRPYGMELSLCQRYYQQRGGNSSDERLANGFHYSTTQGRFIYPVRVVMRASPTLTVSADTDFNIEATGGAIQTTGVSLDQPSPEVIGINVTVASGLTAGQGSQFLARNTNARIRFSAEL